MKKDTGNDNRYLYCYTKYYNIITISYLSLTMLFLRIEWCTPHFFFNAICFFVFFQSARFSRIPPLLVRGTSWRCQSCHKETKTSLNSRWRFSSVIFYYNMSLSFLMKSIVLVLFVRSPQKDVLATPPIF